MNLVYSTANLEQFTRESVGGKGLNLLALSNAAQKSSAYNVPNFFIIPTEVSDFLGELEAEQEVKVAFDTLKKPVVIRSSSPYEDGETASFAGIFNSEHKVNDWEEFKDRYGFVLYSALSSRAEKYAFHMDIELDERMAVIVQEEIVNTDFEGFIDLEKNLAILEYSFLCGLQYDFRRHENQISNLLRTYGDIPLSIEPNVELNQKHDMILLAAVDAKESLDLEGKVQLEFLYKSGKPIDFVQIRKLPPIKSNAERLDIVIPEGVPYIESGVCNGVPGELTLPAYVTFSQAGFIPILRRVGLGWIVGFSERLEEDTDTFERFSKESRLVNNPQWEYFRDLSTYARFLYVSQQQDPYKKVWLQGDSLFSEYILVCDKLDESIHDMDSATPNKKAIITALEARSTSHAMTVARDLGIPAMGFHGDIMELNSFYNQIETGDLIHLKSDGKRAVAYLVKRREKDPYSNL